MLGRSRVRSVRQLAVCAGYNVVSATRNIVEVIRTLLSIEAVERCHMRSVELIVVIHDERIVEHIQVRVRQILRCYPGREGSLHTVDNRVREHPVLEMMGSPVESS